MRDGGRRPPSVLTHGPVDAGRLLPKDGRLIAPAPAQRKPRPDLIPMLMGRSGWSGCALPYWYPGGPRQEETAMKRHASDPSRAAALWASLSIMLLSLAFAAAM